MKKETDKETEDFLKTYSLKPPPEGLKEKILVGIQHKKKTDHVMTPILWKAFAGCVFLLVLVLAVDAGVSRMHSKRINRMTGLVKIPPAETTEDWSVLHDILWEPLDSSQETGREKYYAIQKSREITTRPQEWRESLEKELE